MRNSAAWQSQTNSLPHELLSVDSKPLDYSAVFEAKSEGMTRFRDLRLVNLAMLPGMCRMFGTPKMCRISNSNTHNYDEEDWM